MLVLCCLEESNVKKLRTAIPVFVELHYSPDLPSSLIHSIRPDAVISQSSLLSMDNVRRICNSLGAEKIFLLGSQVDSPEKAREISQLGISYYSSFGRMKINKFLISCCGKNDSSPMEVCDDLGIIGSSRGIREIRKKILRYAPLEDTVIICGKTGSGKDIIARTLHKCSGRSGPFLPINCSAIPESLIESELFGSVKGAFTGADRNSSGYLRAADKGTLFLDEIGDMPLHMQTKLLRVLEDKRITPLGSTRSYGVDVRIITATSRNIKKLIKQGKFRKDLYYRLNVLNIKVPPLAERKTDIPQLVSYFLTQNHSKKRLSRNAMMKLLDHDWPGNIRELKTIIRRAEIMSGEQKLIDTNHITFI